MLQLKAEMQQQQCNLAERESRLEGQHAGAVSAKEDELRARCADLDRREASLKHEQDNLAAGQAQLAKGRHVCNLSGLADMTTCDCYTCLKNLLTRKPESLLFLYLNSLMWYLIVSKSS